jgi:hypothetical protein
MTPMTPVTATTDPGPYPGTCFDPVERPTGAFAAPCKWAGVAIAAGVTGATSLTASLPMILPHCHSATPPFCSTLIA